MSTCVAAAAHPCCAAATLQETGICLPIQSALSQQLPCGAVSSNACQLDSISVCHAGPADGSCRLLWSHRHAPALQVGVAQQLLLPLAHLVNV
jgi:hypothetical protein